MQLSIHHLSTEWDTDLGHMQEFDGERQCE